MAKSSERNGKGPIPTTPEERAIHATAEAANEQRPARRPSWRLFTVTNAAGLARFTWAPAREVAVARVAVADGYVCADPGKTVTKDKVAGFLAALSAQERAELLASYGAATATTSSGRKGK
jgi:hypothetical protein